MKVEVIAPFFDERGIHKRGDIVEVKAFRPEYMRLIEETKADKVETATKPTKTKTTTSKTKKKRV